MHRTTSSASPLSPRCADVSVKAMTPRLLGTTLSDTVRRSTAQRTAQRTEGFWGRKDAQSLVRKDMSCTHFLGHVGQFMFGHVQRCTKTPSLTEKSANLKKRENKFSLLHWLLHPCPFTPLPMASAFCDGPTCCSISCSSAPLPMKDGACPCRGAPTKQR